MRETIVSCYFFVLFAFFFVQVSFAQDRGVDDLLVEIGKIGLSEKLEIPSQQPADVVVDKEIKYVAGADKQWFSDDDAVYEHYQIERDPKTGRVLRSFRYLPGEDRIPFTYDDKLKEFQVMEYGFDGQLIKEKSFNGQSRRKKYELLSTTTYEYDQQGRKSSKTTIYSDRKKNRKVLYSYDEYGQQVRAEEYSGEELEKYHRFEYSSSGQMIKMLEYHVDHEGKGTDGEWFTADDVASSAKETLYGADGNKAEDHKYISSGPDGEWFTGDDQMQYYVIFEFGAGSEL